MIVIIAACHPLGQALAAAFAQKGARVVAIDEDPKALKAVAALNPARIEVLAIEDIQTQLAPMLQKAWGAQRLDMVINLSPLTDPRDISGQMRMLSAILRTSVRGLVTARGALVSVVARPLDPLALISQGMVAALSAGTASLGAELARKQVRLHCVSVSKNDTTVAVETLLYLASPVGRSVGSTTLDLGTQAG